MHRTLITEHCNLLGDAFYSSLHIFHQSVRTMRILGVNLPRLRVEEKLRSLTVFLRTLSC